MTTTAEIRSAPRHVTGSERVLDLIEIVETDDAQMGSDVDRQAGVLRADLAVLEDAERRLEVAVIRGVERDDRIPAGVSASD